MSKWIAGCLLGTALMVFLSIGCGFGSDLTRGEKHTGPVTVRHGNDQASVFEFIRPNKEFFEMRFSPFEMGPTIKDGDQLSDLVYTDLKNHYQSFVKATLLLEAPTPEPVQHEDKVLYTADSAITWCGNGMCSMSQGLASKFYRWSDGGYREKPEPKKSK